MIGNTLYHQPLSGILWVSLSDVNAKPPQEFLQYQLCSAYCLMWKEETPQKGNP